ncbi:protein of unknown function [Paenibacillus alvei]|uniref:Uncharacterized protein n=1 Tax=Paenibacillus alvei TaxID=44250 RepID=A0A383R8Z8_PAEAL|nr:protein of unknown function [Paenibacillus alvei]
MAAIPFHIAHKHHSDRIEKEQIVYLSNDLLFYLNDAWNIYYVDPIICFEITS